jgi:hypothetical protein
MAMRVLTPLLLERTDLVSAWQSYSEDKRWSPSPYLADLEVGFFRTYGRRCEALDITIHADRAESVADFISREANWVLTRRRVGQTPSFRSYRPKFIIHRKFSEAVEDAFGFLPGLGFSPPLIRAHRVVYEGRRYSISLAFNEHDGTLDTTINWTQLHASLSCLFVEAGLGPAQSVRHAGRTPRSLTLAVESQAAALRRLLPMLDRPDGEQLLARCHGR